MIKSDTIVVGDLHCKFQALNTLINRKRPLEVLQCGDFGWWPHEHMRGRLRDKKRGALFDQYSLKPQGASVYWCDGNHENHEDLATRVAGDPEGSHEFMGPGIFYQPRGSFRTLQDGRTVFFFGGADSIDKHRRVEGKSWWRGELPSVAECDAAIHALEAFGKRVDIFVTHTAPESIANHLLEKAFRCSERIQDPTSRFLEFLLNNHPPHKWFFGHFHVSLQGEANGCSWEALSDCTSYSEKWWAWV